ncbi:DUF2079 domain-containing protein [Mumia zhuanghuii]|uniref:DUF2079 domain-containing protein n=2 Tax=Mumia TaxID=1546255 RepID=A0ABW1QHG6_9ACTN|nr:MULTISPECIES: DUF2079 domain-containing protein [Mumia]KAA1422720.1 DUF2079 domain-containing protein [Mumia zhuanghuii]
MTDPLTDDDPRVEQRSRATILEPAVVGPAVLALLCGTAYAALSLLRFRRFETPSWDNAIFEQAIAAYSRLEAPIVDIKAPGYNILGDHFSPITALVAPFYRVFPDGRTLLVAQAVLIALSVYVIARGAVRLLETAAGLAVGVAYGLSFGIASAVWVDFHEVAFGVLFLALAGIAYVERRWMAAALWSLPLLLVKEDLGLTVLAVGVVLALSGARRIGLATAAIGLGGFLLTLFVIIPAFNPGGGYDYVGVIGADGDGGPGPWTTFWTGWDLKLPTLLTTFGITGFLALRSPWVLVAGPTLLWRFVGDNEYYWGTDWHYALVVMPVVFAAMLDAIARLRTADEVDAADAGADSAWASPPWLRRYATHVPAIAAAVALALLPQYPLSRLVDPATYEPSPRAAAAQEVLDLVTEGSSVETDIGMITHLATGRTVYWTGTVGDAVPEWMVIDAYTGWGDQAPDAAAYASQQHPGTSWEVVLDTDGYQVARRTD